MGGTVPSAMTAERSVKRWNPERPHDQAGLIFQTSSRIMCLRKYPAGIRIDGLWDFWDDVMIWQTVMKQKSIGCLNLFPGFNRAGKDFGKNIRIEPLKLWFTIKFIQLNEP